MLGLLGVARKGGFMSKIFLRALLFMLFSSLAVSPSNAEIKLSEYIGANNPNLFKEYIAGLGKGYYWANSQLKHKKQARLFCQPERLFLNADNYISILNKEIKYTDYDYTTDDTIIEVILLRGLEKTFPCSKK